MIRRLDYNTTMDDQVEDLRERMKLLQGDRKANVDLLESSKSSNKELIRHLRKENKELQQQLADLQKSNGKSRTSSFGGQEDDELIQLTNQLNKYRKQYDDSRHKVQDKTGGLEILKDEVRDLELQSRRPNLEDSPQTRKIRMLENRLDKAMIKYNEAQSIRKTYEQIVKRLKEERIGFDNQLAAIERTLTAKSHDYEELLLLSSDANHAKEITQLELERVRGNYEEERRLRDKELREKQHIVKMKLDMNARLEKREKNKIDLVSKEIGDLGEEEEQTMKASVAMATLQQGKIQEEKKEHRTKIDIFENAFRKIKEATGVSDVNEVIQKIVSQEGTTDNLMMLTKENQSRLEASQSQAATLKAHVEELKYSGSGSGHRRKMVDDHEENLSIATVNLERSKLKYERLAKVIINVKAGIEHLNDKIESVRDDGQLIQLTDDTIVDVLYQSEQTLIRLINQTKTQNQPNNQDLKNDGRIVQKADPLSPMGISDNDLRKSRPYNQRIPLPLGASEATTEGDVEDGILEDNDEALSRERVKRASSQVVLAQDKRKKKTNSKKKNGKNYSPENSESEVVDTQYSPKRTSPQKRMI